jgi:hypothetical protein
MVIASITTICEFTLNFLSTTIVYPVFSWLVQNMVEMKILPAFGMTVFTYGVPPIGTQLAAIKLRIDDDILVTLEALVRPCPITRYILRIQFPSQDFD